MAIGRDWENKSNQISDGSGIDNMINSANPATAMKWRQGQPIMELQRKHFRG